MGIRPSVCLSTFSNMNISEISWLIVIKFHQKHHWGLTALGFGPDWIRTLVSIATDSSHRVILGKPCDYSSSFIFDWFFFILAGNKDTHLISDGFEIAHYQTKDLWVSCPWAFWKIPIDLYKRCFMFIWTNLKMPLFIYFSLYLVIIDFSGLVWSPGIRSHHTTCPLFSGMEQSLKMSSQILSV